MLNVNIMRKSLLKAALEGKLTNGDSSQWQWVRLGDVCNIIMGQSPEGSTINKTNGFEFHQGKIFFGNEYINVSDVKTSDPRKIAPVNSVLLCVRAPVGKVNMTNREICIGRGLAALKCKSEIDSRFLFYTLQHYEPIFKSKSTGTTFKAITVNVVRNQLIPLPSLSEQLLIVSKLDSLFECLDNLDKAQRKFQHDREIFRKSILKAALEGRLTGSDSSQWQWVKLGEIISLRSGHDLPKDYDTNEENGTPYITGASNFHDGEIIINRWTSKPESIAHKGDVLLTCKGTVGKVAILELEKAHIARQVMAITPLHDDIKYIAYVMKCNAHNLRQRAKSFIPGIERKDVLNMLIPLPPLEEQQKIVKRLDELMRVIDSLADT